MTSTSSDETLIIKIHSPNEPILQYMSKYERFLNYLFRRMKDPAMTIEFVGTHLLIFIRNADIYLDLIGKQMKILDKLKNSEFLEKTKRIVNIFIHKGYKEKTFPKQGIKYIVTYIQEKPALEKLFTKYEENLIDEYFKYVHDDIVFEFNDNFSHSVHLKSYDSLVAFSNYLYFNVFNFHSFETEE